MFLLLMQLLELVLLPTFECFTKLISLTIPSKTTTLWTMTKMMKMVHYIGGNMVTSDHWAAVKAVLVFNAGCIVNKHAPMTKENIQIECLAAYKKSITDLDPAYFSEAARHFFMASHRNKRSTNYWRGSLSQFSGLKIQNAKSGRSSPSPELHGYEVWSRFS
jgi:hypothetical protein